MTPPTRTSHLETEILEQPGAIGRFLTATVPRLEEIGQAIGAITHVVLVGRGSSDNAARYAQYLFGVQHRLSAGLATPSLQSIYEVTPRFDGALVIGISQSGRSPDVVGVLAAATRQGRPTIAITNDPASALAEAATVVLPLEAGEERSIAATKTYTTSLVAVALVSVALLPPAERGGPLDDLYALPGIVETVLDGAPMQVPPALADLEHLLVTGRGLNYGTGFEVALKVRELSGTLAEAFSPPDLLHGPIAALDAGAAALLVAPAEPSIASQRQLLAPLRERRARIGAISSDEALLAAVDVPLRLAAEPAAWLTPVTTVLAGQRLAAGIARHRGRDLDAPEGLRKVTETS